MKRIVVFDVCNTLINENTTAGFVSFYITQRGGWRKKCVLKAIRYRFSPLRILLAILYRLGSSDYPKKILVRQLRGATKHELESVAVQYVNSALDNLKIDTVWSLLENEKKRGSLILLASASLSVVITALAKKIDAIPFSSELLFSEGICAGSIGKDLSGRKFKVVSDYIAGPEKKWLVVYTDNVSDFSLLQKADEGYAVCTAKSNGLRAKFLPSKVKYVSAK